MMIGRLIVGMNLVVGDVQWRMRLCSTKHRVSANRIIPLGQLRGDVVNARILHRCPRLPNRRHHLIEEVFPMGCKGCMDNKENAHATLTAHLQTALCAKCPSAARWAEEMLNEQQLVIEAESRGVPIGAYLEANRKPARPATERQRRGIRDRLMFNPPPSKWAGKWARVKSYIKAKLPHLIGIRASAELVKDRRMQCLYNFITCSKCGGEAIWNGKAFVCRKCKVGYGNLENRETMGQPCSALQMVSGGLFCGACGCGHRRDANLAVKTTMKYAECPRALWPLTRTMIAGKV